MDGVGARDLQRVTDDRPDGDGECEQAREDEGKRTEIDPVLEFGKPVAHRPPGDRPGDQIGEQDRAGELPDEQLNDVAVARAEHLPDADLLGPMLRSEGGAVINFASPAALRAQANLGAYSAAKAAVVALTRALALEEKENGVRVNALAPGMIDTEQNRKSVPDPEKVKWVSRDDIANVVLFLASDAGKAVTGETIHVLGEGIS